MRQTRRRTQAGLTPGKDDNEVWHHFCRSRLKVSMGVQYYLRIIYSEARAHGARPGVRRSIFFWKNKKIG